MMAQSEDSIAVRLTDAVRMIDDQIAGLESALRDLKATRNSTIEQLDSLGSGAPRHPRSAYGAVKDEILKLLSETPAGCTAEALIKELRNRGLRNERSVRNALFRLKSAGQIVSEGRTYRAR